MGRAGEARTHTHTEATRQAEVEQRRCDGAREGREGGGGDASTRNCTDLLNNPFPKEKQNKRLHA